MPNVEYFARRPVRINGVDFAAGETVKDPTLKSHKISAMLSTGRLGQRIAAEDGTTQRVNLPATDMAPAAPKPEPTEAQPSTSGAPAPDISNEAMWRAVWEATGQGAGTFRQFVMQVCTDMKLSTRGNLVEILKRLENNNVEPAKAE